MLFVRGSNLPFPFVSKLFYQRNTKPLPYVMRAWTIPPSLRLVDIVPNVENPGVCARYVHIHAVLELVAAALDGGVLSSVIL